MLDTPIGRLRAVAFLEGLSFVVLLGLAMPLKYLAGMPMAVKLVGWAHGVLFVAYLAALAAANGTMNWPLRRLAFLFVASLVPFGPFVADVSLKREQERLGLPSGR